MKHYIHRVQEFRVPPATIWQFISTPRNLDRITPADMRFVITSKDLPEDIFSGMQIHYIVAPILNIPLKWTTLIKEVNAPHAFTDTQLRGPYALWEHRHTIEATPAGCRMTDHITYAVPGGIFGDLINFVLVKHKLNKIFDYRYKALEEIFN